MNEQVETATVVVEFSREALAALLSAMNDWAEGRSVFRIDEYVPGKGTIVCEEVP